MPPVSLLATAAELGKTSGQVLLSKLRENGYSRTHAGTGYRRVNPFEIEAGRGDDPSRADTRHYLANWLDYDQDRMPQGTGLIVTGGYGTIDVSYAETPGYSRAPGTLRHLLYVQPTGETSCSFDARGTDPTLGDTASPFLNLGDVFSMDGIGVGMYEGEYIAVGVVIEFDDSVDIIESPLFEPDAGMACPLSVGHPGVAIQVFSSFATINNVSQSPDSSVCFIDDDVDVLVNISMEGPSLGTLQESVDGGAWTTIASSIGAGTVGNLTYVRPEGHSYQYRLRYNDVSPDTWDTSPILNAECTNF